MDMDAFCRDDKIVVNFSTAHVDFLAYGCFLAGRRLLVYKPYILVCCKDLIRLFGEYLRNTVMAMPP